VCVALILGRILLGWRVQPGDRNCLQAFFSVFDIKAHWFVFGQRFVTFRLNIRKMNEDVVA